MRTQNEIDDMAGQFEEHVDRPAPDELIQAVHDALTWAADRRVDDMRVTQYLPIGLKP